MAMARPSAGMPNPLLARRILVGLGCAHAAGML